MDGGADDWRFVCDDNTRWNMNLPNVACAELGFTKGASFKSPFDVNRGDLFYDNVRCTGNEAHLADCDRDIAENCGKTEGIELCCITDSDACEDYICDIYVANPEMDVTDNLGYSDDSTRHNYARECKNPCGRGTFLTLSRTCEPCPADTYQDIRTHSDYQCKQQQGCSVGRAYHATTTSKRTCEPCPAGTYIDTPMPHYETECKSKVCEATYDVAEETSATILCTDGDVVVLKDNTCVCAKETEIACSALCKITDSNFTEDETKKDYQTCYDTCQKESGLDASGVATIKTSAAAVLLLLLLASTA
jgi:hypothetical protein